MAQRNVLTVEDLKGQLAGRRVLVRTDFNVSDPNSGEIKSDSRIAASIRTIQFLVQERAKIFVLSHNERPSSQVKRLQEDGLAENRAWELVRQRLSLEKAAAKLEQMLVGRQILARGDVRFVAATTGAQVAEVAATVQPATILVLENARFDLRDEQGSDALAREIVDATQADVFVLDGFSVAHRPQASVTKVATKVPSGQAVAGYLIMDELKFLKSALLESPVTPYYAFMGGAKVGEKIQVIENLLTRLDRLFVGGAMLYPFLLAKGFRAGADPLGRDAEEIAKDVACAEQLLLQNGKKIVIPTAVTVELKSGDPAERDAADSRGIPEDSRIRDVAAAPLKAAISTETEITGKPRTVVWNGPFGMFEKQSFDAGTVQLLRQLDEWTKDGCVTVTGGGDSEKAIKHAVKVLQQPVRLSHISTGGGAMLELLEGKVLPGIEALSVRET